MKEILEINCYRCGFVDAPRFVFSGPHVKEICNNCGSYLKFVTADTVPALDRIKFAIWGITKDVDLIEKTKILCSFVSFPKEQGLAQRIQYWNLYLAIKHESSKHQNH